MTRHPLLQIFSDKWEQKNRVPDACYINNDHTNLIKVCEDYFEFDTEQDRKHKIGRKTKN